MEPANTTDQRLIELEIKASFTEDLLDQLDQVIVRQQKQIDLLMREVARLGQPATANAASTPRGARDELPPHY
jgi:SlyX protein